MASKDVTRPAIDIHIHAIRGRSTATGISYFRSRSYAFEVTNCDLKLGAIYPRDNMPSEPVNRNTIDTQIQVIRGISVILDIDLATRYQVSPGALLQALRRNRIRFPPDFLFQLNNQELARLKSQSVISKPDGRGRRRRHGV